jgi:hypothetical protein
VQEIVLAFPDVATIAEFILTNDIAAVQVDSTAVTITGVLSKDAVTEAVSNYSAMQVKPELESLFHSPDFYKHLVEDNRRK